MKKLGILISGRGSNFEAIADSIAAGRIDAEIAVVISNRPEARGLALARERGLEAVAIPSKGLDREVYDRMVAGLPGPTRVSHQPDFLVTGWMLATCWSPVSAWHTSTALERSLLRVP